MYPCWSPLGPVWQLSRIVTLVYIDRYIIAMLYIIRDYYSVILVTYRMLNWNCILRDDTYVHRSVLATSLCWATPANSCQSDWLAAPHCCQARLTPFAPVAQALTGQLSFFLHAGR